MKANSDNTKDKKFINHPERLSILYHITRQLNSSLDLDKCLQKIIKQVSKFLNVSRASLMLLDEQDSELTIKCAIGIDRDIMKNTRIKIGQSNSVSSRVAQNGKPLLITDIQKEKGLIKWNSDKYFNNSLLSVPLKRRKKVLGVLNVNNKRDKKVFSKDDLNFLVMLANEFSLAIDNSRLYQRLIQVNKDLKKLHRAKSDFMEDISHNL
ncbi:MAG: GAF domain-containing protein, partial [Candidatus Omnitrophota bacterium]|nr:GAF domain-containing protein [Candidatus Omnitrophota bacterium]